MKFDQIKDLVGKKTVWGRPIVREWARGNIRRLYWADNSYLTVDSAGEVRTSGGMAFRAKLEHRLR